LSNNHAYEILLRVYNNRRVNVYDPKCPYGRAGSQRRKPETAHIFHYFFALPTTTSTSRTWACPVPNNRIKSRSTGRPCPWPFGSPHHQIANSLLGETDIKPQPRRITTCGCATHQELYWPGCRVPGEQDDEQGQSLRNQRNKERGRSEVSMESKSCAQCSIPPLRRPIRRPAGL